MVDNKWYISNRAPYILVNFSGWTESTRWYLYRQQTLPRVAVPSTWEERIALDMRLLVAILNSKGDTHSVLDTTFSRSVMIDTAYQRG